MMIRASTGTRPNPHTQHYSSPAVIPNPHTGCGPSGARGIPGIKNLAITPCPVLNPDTLVHLAIDHDWTDPQAVTEIPMAQGTDPPSPLLEELIEETNNGRSEASATSACYPAGDCAEFCKRARSQVA